MKFPCALFLLMFITGLSAQLNLHLKPNPAAGVDALILDYPGLSSTNYGINHQLFMHAGTASGINNFGRCLIKFDLTLLPPNAILDSAFISLYAWGQTTGTGLHSWISGSNESWIERVIDPWNESTVTWSNQPATTAMNRATLDSAQSPAKNYPAIDVSILVKDLMDTLNYGLMFRLKTEVKYRGLNFCSSDHTDSTKWPELHLYYHLCSDIDSTSLTICDGDSIFLENEYQTVSGLYVDSFPNSGGCDSVTFTDLTVENHYAVVKQSGQKLSAFGPGNRYQWINCNTGKALSGDTFPIYYPPSTGWYAVVIYTENCYDTSECFGFVITGLAQTERGAVLVIRPNPFQNEISVSSPQALTGIALLDINGQRVFYAHCFGKRDVVFELGDYPPGIYLLEIHTEEFIHFRRVVKL